MLSFSHIVIIVMAVIIFISPDKIPHFFKSLAEGMAIFKNTFNEQLVQDANVDTKKSPVMSKKPTTEKNKKSGLSNDTRNIKNTKVVNKNKKLKTSNRKNSKKSKGSETIK